MSDPTQSQKSNNSSSLYLVTFLATLFLLLFVSCAIVLRSYILRRRYQRRLDEAMAAGMLLAPRAQGSKRKRFGAKPRIYDTWLADGGDLWHSMTPLSAQPVFVKRKVKEGTKHPGQDDTAAPDALALPENGNPGGPPVVINNSATPSPSATPRTRFWIPNPPPSQQQSSPQRSFLPWRRRPQQPDTSGSNAPSTDPANPQTSYKVRVEMLQVSVLISMPSPSRAARKNPALKHHQKKVMLSDAIYEGEDDDEDDDDDEAPPLADLAFGVIRVNYRHSKASLLPPASITPSVAPNNLSTNTTPQLGPLVIPSPIPTPLLTTPLPTPVTTPGPERQAQFFQ